jgi:hypothetical protein
MFLSITNYPYPRDQVSEKNNGDVLLDDTGYIDTNTYIAQMLGAGLMLDQIRSGVYEYGSDLQDDTNPQIDPLRAPWTDPADVDAFASGLKQTLENKQAAVDRAAANQSAPALKSDHEQQYPSAEPADPQPLGDD